jgi:hypothetical protein
MEARGETRLGRGPVKRAIAMMALVGFVVTACGSGSGTPSPAVHSVPTNPPTSAPPVPALVGRWEQVHHCEDLVRALDQLGLGPTAPVAVGDFFPDQTPQQLAKKPDVCAGADPLPHSHFFTASGDFGSLDQNLSQVDDGHYTIVDTHEFRIGHATFIYSISGGDTLSLVPVIKASERKQALANPLKFSTPTWQVAVSYPGTTWERAPCEGWC